MKNSGRNFGPLMLAIMIVVIGAESPGLERMGLREMDISFKTLFLLTGSITVPVLIFLIARLIKKRKNDDRK
jgi:heme/copper-type cytochrome/quinol oxidase subunit 2